MSARYNLSIPRGTTFNRQFQLLDGFKNPLDLAGYTLKSEIRVLATDATASAEFSVTKLPNTGFFELSLSDAISLPLTQSCYVWDLRITSGSNTIIPVGGKLTVPATVTRK